MISLLLKKPKVAWIPLALIAVFFLPACSDSPPASGEVAAKEARGLTGASMLVFAASDNEKHGATRAAMDALQTLARENGFTLEVSEAAATFTDANLRRFSAVIFLNASGERLDDQQALSMERYIQAGGGFVGIHAAAEITPESDWFWYRKLVGAVAEAASTADTSSSGTLQVDPRQHAATATLPEHISLDEVGYQYRDHYEFIQPLIHVSHSESGERSAISWYHNFDGGRSFYTGLGQQPETFTNPHVLQHLLGGIRYAVGVADADSLRPTLDYSQSRPENNRFIKKTLVENLNEPVKFDFFPNGDAIIALRPGEFLRVDYQSGQAHPAGTLPVEYKKIEEWGLVGVAVDPDFATTNWIYAAFTIKEGEDNFYQKVSRFQWRNGRVDPESEQEILRYAIDFNCCHTGGDLRFGNHGELFFSTGDNTNPHEQDGYAPLDFRPDLAKNDGLRAPGNTMDLRGKVLRIKPRADGGYDIPEGNLFSDPAEGRPEIYVMGARNPYSITIDKKTNTLFYGDIGPDANVDSDLKGVRGYDEVNRVTAAGNFGWPLVIGQNRPYRMYDYVNQTAGELVDPNAPLNTSPNNTGARQLPPAQPAFIAYPYAVSDKFPELGAGGRSALVADVYRAEDYPASDHRYPAYYNNKLFITDFMRAWVKAVSVDEAGRIQKIEPFAPQIKYSLPIAARFSPDGTLYVLEYGMSWFTGNPDARLSRIEYVGAGNRPPLAAIEVNKPQAGLPAVIQASALGSADPDGDAIRYRWRLACVDNTCPAKELGEGADISLPFDSAGVFSLELQVTDTHGASGSATQELVIGNEPATIELLSEQNQSFFWSHTSSFNYRLKIHDHEDGEITRITNDNPQIRFAYRAAPAPEAQGHQTGSLADQANSLLDANNCLSCHKMEETVVGPALRDVARRYQADPNAMQYLVNKIGNGGSGVWGAMNMPAFAGLGEADLKVLASYILGLNDDAPEGKFLPFSGEVALDQHGETAALLLQDEPFTRSGEAYTLTASYTDQPSHGIASVGVTKTFSLVPHRFPFERVFDEATATRDVKQGSFRDVKVIRVPTSTSWSGFMLGNFDLTEISSVRVGAVFFKQPVNWLFELRRDNAGGELIASGVLSTQELRAYQRISVPVQKTDGYSNIYMQVRMEEDSAGELALQDISFEK